MIPSTLVEICRGKFLPGDLRMLLEHHASLDVRPSEICQIAKEQVG